MVYCAFIFNLSNLKKLNIFFSRLLAYCYAQTAVVEVVSGYFTSFVHYMCYGWMPWDLLWRQDKWNSPAINDMMDSYGQEWVRIK